MSNNTNWFTQRDNAAYGCVAVSASVVMRARALTHVRGIDGSTGTDFAEKPATAAPGHRTWSPPNG